MDNIHLFAWVIGWVILICGGTALTLASVAFIIYKAWWWLMVISLQLHTLWWRVKNGKSPEERQREELGLK